VTNSIRVPGLCALLTLSLLPVQGCTDLTEIPNSAVSPENFFRNEAEVLAGLAGVYAQLRGDGSLWAYYNLSEVTTDEIIVPTRPPDWFDNGRWLELHRHAWTAGSPSGLEDINRGWVDTYRGVANANVLLDALDRVDVPNEDVIRAELRALRAFYYYMLNDLFGGVPIATDIEIRPRERATRDSLFRFIESELLAVRTILPASWPAANHGRLTKGGADAILASMYVNAGVFARETGVTATSYNSCLGITVSGGLDACQAAINYSDSLLNSPLYDLNPDGWRANFTADNQTSPENILVVRNLNADGLGLNLVMRALHYNQFTPQPWNGFATLAETYRQFDSADARRGQTFLVGQQYNQELLVRGDTVPVTDRAGVNLIFVDTIGDATNARENEGARILKYPPDPNHVQEHNGNDFVYFRLGEIYLIKAEALLEQGDAPGALVLVNDLRARVFTPPQPLLTLDRNAILAERLFELAGEAKRRQDLIRHGGYTAWTTTIIGGKGAPSEPFRILMPIPITQMAANPLLVQNPGY
jgi:starch-binding outer membrane protein, SusD/RagB family